MNYKLPSTMTLHPALRSIIPAEIARLVRAAFSKGNAYTMHDNLLEQFKQRDQLKAGEQASPNSTQVLETLQLSNRIEDVGETLRRALNHLAIAAPEWLLAQVSPEWFDRYGTLFEQYRIPKKTDLQQLALTIGRDGQHLLSALDAPHAPEWLRQAPSVEALRSVWVQQYDLGGRNPTWRKEVNDESEE